MKTSEEQRLGNAIIAALERVRLCVCRTGAAAQWHLSKAANVVRKPKLLGRIAPHLAGDQAKDYLASLPGWIEETKQQETACGALWGQRQNNGDAHVYGAERDRLVTLLVRYDFALRSYEKLARQPKKLHAELAVTPDAGLSPPTDDAPHDEASMRMTEKEYGDLEEQINTELRLLDESRAELVAAHDSLVAKWAEKSTSSVEEATTFARRGLEKAAENFDVRRGFRFATYAQWWIKTAIKEKKTWDA